MPSGIIKVVSGWMKELRISLSRTYLKHQLLSHPDYPSLLSITDTLNELGIENTALRVEKGQLTELPVPFLAHLNGKGGEFVIVNNGTNPELQHPEFFERWDGVVIAAEKASGWHHNLNSEWLGKELKKSRILLFTLSVFGVFIFISAGFSFEWIKAGLLLIAATGVFVSWLIVSKDLGIENKLADQVCGANADCNTVIHSSAGKLPLGVAWSDAGIIYFPFLLILLLVASSTNTLSAVYPLIVLFAAAALPVTFVSVYYQWRVIKKWCRLCLVTVALLWLQFIVLLPQAARLLKDGFDNTVITNAVPVVFLLFVSAAAWLWLRPLLKKNKELEAENFTAQRFRRNPDIFNALLEKQKKLAVSTDGLGIVLGNPVAENTIIKVCNPYCDPCAKAHRVIDELLAKNDNLKVQIIFRATDDGNDIRAKPVKHLMALYEKNDSKLIKQALDDWYLAEKKDYDVFAEKYVLNGELEKQGDKLNAMKEWCNNVKIEFTPTFFVNGYQFPKLYKVEDIKYFLT